MDALEFPELMKGSYHKWVLMMKVNLRVMSLWNTVESDSIELYSCSSCRDEIKHR
jgi:hypothetical protein